MRFTNQLIKASSPYLLQHAHNPVNWNEWNDHAWNIAKAEGKLVIVSIGYAACHWCHVMEHECFENEETAAIMNQHFVSIKVDREERPDVDAVYMDACQLITQRGGWPLNVICLPDGKPIHAGTYFPKTQWDDLLGKLAQFYITRKEEAIEYAEKLTEGVKQLDLAAIISTDDLGDDVVLNQTFEKWQTMFDPILGGYNWAPKFPMPSNYECLLQMHSHNCNPALRFQVENTLDKMALGGIYDQIGGGFSRYSVDAHWKIPHFEKMLYDNAQLISLYSHAYRLNKKALYKKIIVETIQFVQSELSHQNGLFFSALDADSEGVEGKFYVWKKQEIESVLGEKSTMFCEYFRIDQESLWEHDENVLMANQNLFEFAQNKNIDIELFEVYINDCRQKLHAHRTSRIRPGLDDKIICSWNALMIQAFCDANSALNNQSYLHAAMAAADSLISKLFLDGVLYRIWKDGVHSIPAFSEDYALLTEALMKVYQISFDEKYLHLSKQLVDISFQKFYDVSRGFFKMKSIDDVPLFVDKVDITDDVISSANSVFANVLYKLGHFYGEPYYINTSLSMLNQVKGKFHKFPTGYSNWISLFLIKKFGLYQIVFSQKPSAQFIVELSKYYIPNAIYAAAGQLPISRDKVSDDFNIYVCKDETCFSPVNSLEKMISLIFVE